MNYNFPPKFQLFMYPYATGRLWSSKGVWHCSEQGHFNQKIDLNHLVNMRNAAILPFVSPNCEFGNDPFEILIIHFFFNINFKLFRHNLMIFFHVFNFLPYVSGNINYELQTWNENLHNMSSGFCLEPKFLDNHENQQRVENYSFPSFQSSLVTYQPG